MKNISSGVKNHMLSRYLEQDMPKKETKRTDINVLLNRVKLNQINESKRKLYFSAIASTGLVLFGFLIFKNLNFNLNHFFNLI